MTTHRPKEGNEADRPDLRGPRGNPQADQADVDRAIAKLDRVLRK
jgi:hypothetical protein